jgi:hypothetical protein
MAPSTVLILGFAAVAQASFESIVGYAPGSKVTDHNALDMDQSKMQNHLGEDGIYTTAKDIYTSGGHSKSYAEFTYSGTLANAYASGKNCQMTLIGGGTATGKLKDDVSAAANQVIKCIYPTSDVQATYQACQVGGLPTDDQTTTGCIDTSQTVVLSDDTNSETLASANIGTATNKNGRTLQGFATAKTNFDKMYDTSASCPGCPYDTYRAFFDYYGEHGWADKFVTAAFDQTSATFGSAASGTAGAQDQTLKTSYYTKTADFSAFTNFESRRESIKKGTAYMHVWMYTIREFEDAIDDCSVGSLDNNYGSVHAWDEGVAFYAGSLEGTSVASGIANSGVMVHALADKR